MNHQLKRSKMDLEFEEEAFLPFEDQVIKRIREWVAWIKGEKFDKTRKTGVGTVSKREEVERFGGEVELVAVKGTDFLGESGDTVDIDEDDRILTSALRWFLSWWRCER